MGRKAKCSAKQKIQACEDYLSGIKSAVEIARQLGMGKRGKAHVKQWSKMYKAHGSSVFEESHHNRSYSKEFKEKVVREYLSERGSFR